MRSPVYIFSGEIWRAGSHKSLFQEETEAHDKKGKNFEKSTKLQKNYEELLSGDIGCGTISES